MCEYSHRHLVQAQFNMAAWTLWLCLSSPHYSSLKHSKQRWKIVFANNYILTNIQKKIFFVNRDYTPTQNTHMDCGNFENFANFLVASFVSMFSNH